VLQSVFNEFMQNTRSRSRGQCTTGNEWTGFASCGPGVGATDRPFARVRPAERAFAHVQGGLLVL